MKLPNNSNSTPVGIIGSVAPDRYTHKTHKGSSSYTNGKVQTTVSSVGSSYASPYFASAVIAVKHFFLAKGHTWVNNPGRLHSIMMAMHDRHSSTTKAGTTSRRTSGNGKWWGMGRLNLRRLSNNTMTGAWGWVYKTKSFVAGAQLLPPYHNRLSGPMPSGLEMVKCTTFQQEDLSERSYINDIEVRLIVSNDTRTSCSSSPTGSYSTVAEQTDSDYRKVVAYEGALTGRCVWLQIDPQRIGTPGVTTNNFCTWASEMDDE
ncbi:MAG: hypothetical protein V3W44_00210 [Dehalococcoidales bacterium]